MAGTIEIIVTRPAPDACPSGNLFYDGVDWVGNHITATFTPDAGTGVQIIRQSATPAPTANTVWHRIDATGGVNAPLGEYVYFNGRFVPNPTGRRIGDYMLTDFNPNGYMNSDGKGLFVPVSPATDTPNIAGPLFGWHLANNVDSTPNVKNRFMMAGYKYIDGTGWVASVKDDAPATTYSDQTNGGREGITITGGQLPPISTRTYSATATGSSAQVLSGLNYDPGVAAVPINTAGVAQSAIQPINPLYKVVGVFQWIGYAAASA